MKLRTVEDPNDPSIPDSFSTHIMTVGSQQVTAESVWLKFFQGIDKVHAQGLTGKGITIGMSA